MVQIHATAVVDPKAELGADVTVGPFCVLGPQAELGDRVKLHSHVVVAGDTRLGAGCEVYPFASIGHNPQDQKYRGEASRLEIGEATVIRENVTINPGTEGGGLLTKIGSHCLLMVSAHVAHDCQLGDHVILVNAATLAGHVTLGDHVIVGGLSAIHQFVRVGKGAFIGGMSGVERDVIPYGMAIGNRASLAGLNLVGLKRQKRPRQQIHELRQAYRALFAEEGTLIERCAKVEAEFGANPLVSDIVGFIRSDSDRSFCVPNHGAAQDQD
jgi:UDP-N-acetylglucosamine acyltransferase